MCGCLPLQPTTSSRMSRDPATRRASRQRYRESDKGQANNAASQQRLEPVVGQQGHPLGHQAHRRRRRPDGAAAWVPRAVPQRALPLQQRPTRPARNVQGRVAQRGAHRVGAGEGAAVKVRPSGRTLAMCGSGTGRPEPQKDEASRLKSQPALCTLTVQYSSPNTDSSSVSQLRTNRRNGPPRVQVVRRHGPLGPDSLQSAGGRRSRHLRGQAGCAEGQQGPQREGLCCHSPGHRRACTACHLGSFSPGTCADLEGWRAGHSELGNHSANDAHSPDLGRCRNSPPQTGAERFQKSTGLGAPTINGKEFPIKLGFTKENELFVGRLAMIGFASSLLGEILTGKGALAQVRPRHTHAFCTRAPAAVYGCGPAQY
jgi:hypothetical protein